MLRNSTILGILALSIFGVGCVSKLTGNEGNFTFSYPADDDILDFNKPVAVGARIDLQVREVGNNRPVTLLEVTADQDVFGVVSFVGNEFTLEAVGDGNALIEVRGETQAGKELPDSVNFNARVPEVLKLGHTCVSTQNGRYLTNQRILVPFEMERSNGQPVIGYGLYPVSFTQMGMLTLDRSLKAQQFLYLDTGPNAGSVSIASTIDSTELPVTLVDEGDINGAEVVLGNAQETDVGETNLYYVLPTTFGDRICQADTPKSVVATTSDICRVEDRTAPTNDDHELGWIAVTGLSAGTCKFAVTYPRGDGGTGLTTELEIEIAP